MKFLSILILIFCVAIFSSCENDFESINTNPNAPNEVLPPLLLRQVIYAVGEEMSYEGFVAGNLLAQHFTMVDFNLFDRHRISDPQLGGNPWPVLYSNLRDNDIILNLSRENNAFAVYEGPALILKAYMSAMLTDIYGDVPYSEALQGINNNTLPAYDQQEAIYTGTQGIFENLADGISAIENYNGAFNLEGDILYQGNLEQWLKLGRSLQVKYLMRVSNKIDIKSTISTIFDEGNFIQSAIDNATFDFTNDRPNSFRMQQLRDGDFNLFVLSETMHDVLTELNDSRIEVLYRPTGNTNSDFQGLLNGPDASATSISVAEFSLTGTIFRERTGDLDANFMTSWETLFLLAEAAARNFISADAKQLYDQAVEQAHAYWGIEMPENYLTSGPAVYGANGSNPIEQILTQKWIANSINGYEGWIEYRRTGFPSLNTIDASLNDNLIPVRMPYPSDEAALNTDNYNSAIRNNDNSINAPVWWDVD